MSVSSFSCFDFLAQLFRVLATLLDRLANLDAKLAASELTINAACRNYFPATEVG